MKCPFCQSSLSKVVDKRAVDSRGEIRRRRECLKCSKRFTTYERVESVDLYVIKKDGRREQFDRDKVLGGLLKATEKRPVSVEEVEKMVECIEQEIRKKDSIEVPSKSVGEIVMRKLKALDKVAYIRFASVYRAFEDVESFEKEVRNLLKNTADKKIATTNKGGQAYD